MKLESHEESVEEHKNIICKWALEVQGLEKSQRIIGLHASRAAIDILSIFLHKNKLVDDGLQLNHRWFKSEKVVEKLPEFPSKNSIIKKMVELENLCETLTYGTQKPVEKTEKALKLFREIDGVLNKKNESK